MTLANGTTDTIENTLVASTPAAQIGIAMRNNSTIKFSSVQVLGFTAVEIPEMVVDTKETIDE